MSEKVWSINDVPEGTSDFAKIQELNLYYVDKTQLIADVLDKHKKVYLFTRPRRFGKSLNLSMLDCYFNQKYKNNTWFDDLNISKRKDLENRKNAYPVIRIDFKDIGVPYDQFIGDMAVKLSNVYRDHVKVVQKCDDEDDIAVFKSIRRKKADIATMKDSLRFLSKLLHDCYGKKAIVLIDEYDRPMHKAFGTDDQQKILDFMRDILSSVLKSNDSLEFAVVTGIMQISKESIFSGLNNVVVNNIFSTECDEAYGFTDAEVKKICEDFGHSEKYAEAKEWYDGYRFGNADVYNPLSLMAYVGNGFAPGTYWAGTSGNSIIRHLLSIPGEEAFDELKILSDGGTISRTLDGTITFSELQKNRSSVYSVMAMSGYLNAIPLNDGSEGYSLSLPNKEMISVFRKMTVEPITDKLGKFKTLYDSLLSGDTFTVSKTLKNMFMSGLGFRIVDSEHVYQAYLLGLFYHLGEVFDVIPERQAGKGFCDIVLKSKKPEVPNIMLELKRRGSRDSKDLVKLANKALEQIKTKEYSHGLKGKTLVYGVAVDKLDNEIVAEIMDH